MHIHRLLLTPRRHTENLLLTHRGGDAAEVKIIDFGLSKMLSGQMPQAKSFLGTRVRGVWVMVARVDSVALVGGCGHPCLPTTTFTYIHPQQHATH